MSAVYSNYYPREDLLRALPVSLEQRVVPLKEGLPGSFVAFHNSFVDYSIAQLLIATGHRPIIDPFCYFSDIDIEQGICLISDKVLYESRAWRLVALPPIAVNQISAYREHLAVLTSYIARYSPTSLPLAYAINENLKGNKDSPLIPQFFFLDDSLEKTFSVTPGRLKEHWGSVWPWPSTYGRHVLASEPGDDVYPAHLVSAHMGHSQGPDHPLGRLSVLSLDALLERQASEMEGVLHGLGWCALHGLVRTPDLPLEIPLPKSMPALIHESPLLGPDRRRQIRSERDQNRVRCAGLVRDAISAVAEGKELPSPLPVDLRARITAEIAERVAAIGCSSEPFMKLANRALFRISQEKSQASFHIDLEPSPFTSETVNDLRDLRRLRQEFLRYIDQCGREELVPTPERRFAEMLLASALWGGREPLSRFREFAVALIDRCYSMSDLVWIELVPATEDEVQCVRWWPDPISLSLLISLARSGNIERLRDFSENDLSQALGKLLGELGEPSKRSVDRRRLLSQMAQTANLLEEKGFVRAAEQDAEEFSSASLPLPTLVRVLTGRRLAFHKAELTTTDVSLDDEGSLKVFAVSRKRDARARNPHRGAPMWDVLRCYLREAEKAPAKGVARRHRARRGKLAKFIIQGLGTGEVPGSTIECLIADWTLHLCQRGTRRKSELSYSTVRKYAGMVGKPLVDLARAQDFLSLTDVEFEEIYLQALDYTTDRERPTLVGRLREFHLFLASQAGVDEPDWSVLYRAAGAPIRDLVDANFITDDEYRDVLRSLLKLPDISLLMRHQYAFLVFLGYRFGLRFGEALRLRFFDVATSSDRKHIWVQIRNSVFGQTKTAAGVRQIPLVGELSDLEREIFSGIMTAAEAKAITDSQVALVSSEVYPRELVDRYTASRYIHACLRGVTGDPELRFHHLRHSWATRLFAISFGNSADRRSTPWTKLAPLLGCKEGLCEKASELWGEADPAERPLKAIAAAIGHVSEVTTLEAYIHTVDIYASDGRWRKIPSFSDYAAAYSLGLGYQAARRRRARLGADTGDIAAIVTNEKFEKWFKSPSVKTTAAKWKLGNPSSYEDKLTPIKVGRILWLSARRGGIGAGVSEAVGVSEESARKVLDATREIERMTGYDRYRAHASSSDILHRLGASHQTTVYLDKPSEIRRLRELLRLAEMSLDRMSDLERGDFFSGIKAWAISHDAPRGRAYFTSIGELELFLGSAKTLYPQGVAWVAKIPNKISPDPDLVVRLQALGCSLESDPDRVPRAREKSRFLAATRIEVRARVSDPQIVSALTLYRTLFVIAVWGVAAFDYRLQPY